MFCSLMVNIDDYNDNYTGSDDDDEYLDNDDDNFRAFLDDGLQNSINVSGDQITDKILQVQT